MAHFERINNGESNGQAQQVKAISDDAMRRDRSQWDESSLSKLLGLDTEGLDKAKTFRSKNSIPSDNSEEELDEISFREPQFEEGDENVLSRSELFEEELDSDPHHVKTEPTLSKHPLAKLSFVGLSMFAVFFVGGLFLSNIMSTKIQPSPTAKQLPLETEPKKKQPESEAEVGKLKTELALGKQEEQLAALNRAKSPKNRDAAQKSNNPEKSDSLPKQANSPPPPPTNRAPDPISRPTPAPMPVSSTLAPSREPANFPPVDREPVYREPVSRPSSVVPAAVNSPPPKPVSTPEPQLQEPKKESTNPVNPLEQWMALKELGSYGNLESDETEDNGESLTPSTEESAVTSATSDELLQPENGSTSLNQNEERLATVPQASLVVRNNEIDGSATLQQGGNTLLNAEANGDSSTIENFSEDFSAEEYNLLTGTPVTGTVGEVRNLQVGQQVGGVVVTPIISTESDRISQSQTAFRNNSSNNASDKTESGGGERFVVRLSQPLVSEQGQPLLLAGTLVVFEVKGVHPSGMVSSDAIALIVDEREYLLPPGSISIRGEEGKPLIADKYDDKGPEIASLDVGTAVVGSLANVGRILNRPKSEDIDDYDSVLGSRRRSRVERGSPNILGAILEGGFTPLLEDIRERNKRAIAEIQSRPNLWYISPETQVLVFVNRSFDL